MEPYSGTLLIIQCIRFEVGIACLLHTAAPVVSIIRGKFMTSNAGNENETGSYNLVIIPWGVLLVSMAVLWFRACCAGHAFHSCTRPFSKQETTACQQWGTSMTIPSITVLPAASRLLSFHCLYSMASFHFEWGHEWIKIFGHPDVECVKFILCLSLNLWQRWPSWGWPPCPQ